MAIRDNLSHQDDRTSSRDRVIAAIYETVIRPDLYDAFMEAWDVHIQAMLNADAAQDGESGDPRDFPHELDVDPELQAHFERAYDILERLGRRAPQTRLGDQVRAAPGFAVLFDADGEMVAASRRALETLDTTEPLASLKSGLAGQSATLLARLMRAARKNQSGVTPVVLSSGGEPRHLIARLAHVPAPQASAESRPMVMIEALEYRWSDSAAAMLVASFGLSPAELEIVRQLLAGYSLGQIAERSGRSKHTVRNQAKAVLAKTGAPGQVDLIRLAVFLINQDRKSAGVDSPERSALGSTRMAMATGKHMQVFQLGTSHSRSVIYLHGMMDGLAAVEHHARAFQDRGIRVVAPARPGFGQSDPPDRPDAVLDQLCAHVTELIDRLSLDRPVILAHLGGAAYGHALAGRLRQRVAGLVAVSGVAPLVRLSQLTTMPPRQRAVACTARFAPALLRTVLRAGIAQVDGENVNDFLAALFPPESREHAVINRLDLARLLHSGFRFSVEQGPSGLTGDARFLVRNWLADMKDPPGRAIYLHGAHDPVVSAQSVVRAMSGQPNVELRVLPDTGQLVIYEQIQAVFDALDDVFAGCGRS